MSVFTFRQILSTTNFVHLRIMSPALSPRKTAVRVQWCALLFCVIYPGQLLGVRIKDRTASCFWHSTQTQETDVPKGIAKISPRSRTNLTSNSLLTQTEGCTAFVKWHAFKAMLAQSSPEVSCEDRQMVQDVRQCASEPKHCKQCWHNAYLVEARR